MTKSPWLVVNFARNRAGARTLSDGSGGLSKRTLEPASRGEAAVHDRSGSRRAGSRAKLRPAGTFSPSNASGLHSSAAAPGCLRASRLEAGAPSLRGDVSAKQLRGRDAEEHAGKASQDQGGHIAGVVDWLEHAGAVAHFDVADGGGSGSPASAPSLDHAVSERASAEAPLHAGHGDDRRAVALDGIAEDLAGVGGGLDDGGDALDESLVAHDGDSSAAEPRAHRGAR